MWRLRLAPFVAVAAVLLPAAAHAAPSPKARAASSVAAARTQHSVHYVSIQKSGTTSVTIVGDAGGKAGIQRLTYREKSKSGHLTVIVVKRTAYLRGDTFTLRRFLGFTPAAAAKLADQWLRVPHSSHAYAPVAEDVTFASAMSDLRPDGRLANVKRTSIAGHRALGVRGTSSVRGRKVTQTLWIAAAGKPLPIQQATVAPDGAVSITYSDWNKAVHVRAPRGAFDPTNPNPPLNVA